MRGEDPDWLHYSDRADRFGEHRFESIRVYANTALATGIGGTIFTLSLHFFLGSLEESEAAVASHAALEDLLHHMGWALIASAIGVVNNLLILLVLLPFGNKRFNRALAELNDKLHATRDDNKPAETLAEAVRDKLGEAFKDAVERFPDAFARLDVSVEALGEIIEVQTKEILRAESGLREGADTLASASEAIAPAAQELSASISRLLTLPSADLRLTHQDAGSTHVRDPCRPAQTPRHHGGDPSRAARTGQNPRRFCKGRCQHRVRCGRGSATATACICSRDHQVCRSCSVTDLATKPET